jgi:FkbM family methyltransferase
VPRRFIQDLAIRVLIREEALVDGYEAGPRCFFDAHLQPGDVFVDVGAHWGVFSLSAASRWPGEVTVLAIEPHPENVARLMDAVSHNGFDDRVEIVAAACGSHRGFARLRYNTSMGHTIAGWSPIRELPGPPLYVPVVTLDELFRARPPLQERRVFLKVDVEGAETQVLTGARALLASGRVQAILWEYGLAAEDAAEHGRVVRLVRSLERRGFTSFYFPEEGPGPYRLVPLPDLSLCDGTYNVLSLGRDCRPRDLYTR